MSSVKDEESSSSSENGDPDSKNSSSSSSVLSSDDSSTTDSSSSISTAGIESGGVPKKRKKGKVSSFRRRRIDVDGSSAVRRQKRDYYDSDNSIEPERKQKSVFDKVEFVNWDEHADLKWGRRPLFHDLSPDDISSLVGWATTQTSSEKHTSSSETTTNPLIGLDSAPLPLSFLNYFALKSSKLPEMDKSLEEWFDDSALVAVGMVLEEMMTASLLPLAGLHVLRCRELEANDVSEHGGPARKSVAVRHPVTGQDVTYNPRLIDRNENPVNEWALPPEEAIMKLLQQGVIPDTGMPLYQEPTRSIIDSKTIGSHRRQVQKMCQELKLKPGVVQRNKELFNVFISRRKTRLQETEEEDTVQGVTTASTTGTESQKKRKLQQDASEET